MSRRLALAAVLLCALPASAHANPSISVSSSAEGVPGNLPSKVTHRLALTAGATPETVGRAVDFLIRNRDSGGTYDRDVQRCANVASNDRVDYYDVTYNFRGVEHHVQMQQPPGPTLTVSPDGEPRI